MVTATISVIGAPSSAALIPTDGKMWFGSYSNMPQRSSVGMNPTSWRDTASRMVPDGASIDLMSGRRSFSSADNPSNVSGTTLRGAAGDVAAGIKQSWLSVKPDPALVIANNTATMANVSSLAASMRPGDQLMAYHEPENDPAFIGANLGDFVTYSRNMYTAVKAGNSDVGFGYCAMAYVWGLNNAATANFLDWYPGDDYCDWIGIDVYWMEFRNVDPIQNHGGFARWWQGVQANVDRSKIALGLNEYGHTWAANAGVTGHTDANIASSITADANWLAANGFSFLHHWDASQMETGAGASRDWALSGMPSGFSGDSAAIGPQSLGDNRPLSRQAWRDAVGLYAKVPGADTPIGVGP